MAADLRLSQRIPGKGDVLSYELMDRRLSRERFPNLIVTIAVFRPFPRQFAAHAIRLDAVHAKLALGGIDAAIPEIARCFEFINAGRLNAAYCRRFGESPRETIRYRT
jgi:hypothetical protein